MSVVTTADRAHEPWSREYWLGHCEGYEVDDVDGHLGCVEEVVWGIDEHLPVALKVRTGFDRSIVVLPIERVREVQPRAERIVV